MDEPRDAGMTTDEDTSQRSVWGPDPAKDREADDAFENTRRQLETTSLERTTAGRSLDEIGEGLERAKGQEGYGREAQ